MIPLGDVTMTVCGTIENKYSLNHSIEQTFLIISLHDSDNDELGITSEQNFQYKKELKKLMTV